MNTAPLRSLLSSPGLILAASLKTTVATTLATTVAASTFATSAMAAGDAPVPPRWTSDAALDTFAADVAIGTDGTTYGLWADDLGSGVATIQATAADGTALWTFAYPSPIGGASASKIATVGDHVLAGVRGEDKNGRYVALLTFDLDGNLIRENRTSTGSFAGLHIATHASGRRAIAVADMGNVDDVTMKSWDADGTLELDRTWSFSGSDGIGEFVFMSNGDLVVSHGDYISPSGIYMVRRVDPSGADVFTLAFPAASSFLATDLHVAPHADGTMTIAGTPSHSSGFWSTRIIRLDASGQPMWDVVRVHETTEYSFTADLVASNAPGEEGVAYLAFSGEQERIERFEADGTVSQITLLDGPDDNTLVKDVAMDSDGRVVALLRDGPTVRVTRVANEGTVEWQSQYIGTGDGGDIPIDLATGPNNAVAAILVGRSTDGFRRRAVTQRFNFDACPGDVTADGITGFADLLGVLGAWDATGGSAMDLDGSGRVDLSDVLTVLAAWGGCTG
ncbi:MAG: hypothetical protein AB8G96_14225 [Phycisphaerales bacterium]